MSSHRIEKVAAMIREEVSRLLIENISDPTLQSVSITDVQLSKDLKKARVFYSLRTTDDPKLEKETQRGFGRASSFLRKQLGESLKMRYTPELIFQRDAHTESVSRLMHLFDTMEPSREE